ncbi:MAG: hypothetical protein GY679_01875 [Mycoplasma sp.]|nr:hypothetical protein [Mycoplasma sp.]
MKKMKALKIVVKPGCLTSVDCFGIKLSDEGLLELWEKVRVLNLESVEYDNSYGSFYVEAIEVPEGFFESIMIAEEAGLISISKTITSEISIL